MKILISFIGNSDPVKNKYDGPALHIIRKEKIDKVYFLLSKSMQNDIVKNNLVKSIYHVNSKIGFKTDIIFEDMNIDNPSLFSSFNITEYIDKIVNENKGNDFFYNLSSSTPQMLAALALDIVINERVGNFYQVTNPEYKEYRHKKLDETDLEDNYDELSESDTRIVNTNISSFRTNQIKEKLKSKVNNRSYKDLYYYCKELRNVISEDSKLAKLIKYAYDSDSLIDISDKHLETLKKINKRLYRAIIDPNIKNSYIKENIHKTVNYYYFLKNEFERKEYMNLILKTKPLFFELMKYIIIKKIDTSDYRYWKKFIYDNKLNQDNQIIYDKLTSKYQRYVRDNRSDIRLDTQELIDILESFDFTDFKDEIDKIRDHEKKVRNELAHDITNKYNNNKVRKQAEETMANLEIIFKGIITDYVIDINYSFFDDLNNEILLEISKIKGD